MAQPAIAADGAETARDTRGGVGPRLPAFDTTGGEAFAMDGAPAAYALLHHRRIPLRQAAADAYARLRPTALVKLIEQRVVEQPGGARLLSVLERPSGPCLADLALGQGLPDRIIRNQLLPAAAGALRALHEAGVAHRGINPKRLFFQDASLDRIRLMECFSAPAGGDQPAVFEPIERMTALATGRGEGSPADDYYALGVTILTLIKGQDLAQGRTPEQLMAAKIAHGSYWALTGGAELAGGLNVMLRGLLQDEPKQRWGGDELADWLGGATRTAATPTDSWSFARQVNYGAGSYGDRRALAQALAADTGEAAAYIKKLDLEHWLSLHLPQAPTTSEFFRLILHGQGGRRSDIALSGPDYLVARFCAMLDPMGPIRFRRVIVMPDGLGPALADGLSQGPGAPVAEDLAELILSPLLSSLGDIVSMMPGGVRRGSFSNDLVKLAKLIHVRSQNDAVERALYVLNPGLICQSGLFAHGWVATPADLARAAEALAAAKANVDFADPHITAFLAANSKDAAAEFRRLPAAHRDGQALASVMLSVLGKLQQVDALGPMPALGGYFGKRLLPALRKLKSSSLRERAEKRLQAVIDKGDLELMARLFDLPSLQRKDMSGFNTARGKVHLIDRRLLALEAKVLPSDPLPLLYGARGAALFATLVLAAAAVFWGLS